MRIGFIVLLLAPACGPGDWAIATFLCANGERVYLRPTATEEGLEALSWRSSHDEQWSEPVAIGRTEVYGEAIQRAFANCVAPVPLVD